MFYATARGPAAVAALAQLALAQLALASMALGQERAQSIRPPDVFRHVETVRAELEELRFLMGMPKNTKPELIVRGAAPRDVYFQALTLFDKADRLCFAHTRQRAAPPRLFEGNIQPGDVYDVVDVALKCVRAVKEKYELTTAATPSKVDQDKRPTDVFHAILQANRQLNLMLDQPFSPRDVFQQVTRAISYASRLLEQFPDATTLPDEPAYERGKRPADVYARLLACVERLRVIARLSDVNMLELEVDELQIQQAASSDVYDIASLIVAELAYLHSSLPEANSPRKVYYAGRKFPAHVYQRAGILDRQLVELERCVKQNPDWLE